MTDYDREHWEELLRTIVDRIGIQGVMDILSRIMDEDIVLTTVGNWEAANDRP